MKKILFYIPFIKIGGLEQVAIEYLKLLIQRGYKVDLIIDFNLSKQGNTFEQSIPQDVEYQFIKSEKVSLFIYKFRTLGKKYKIFNIFLYGFLIVFDFINYHFKTKKILDQGQYDTTISFYQFLTLLYNKEQNIKKHYLASWICGTFF